MFHSITIGDKNTWDDWRLVPVTRPVFNPPPQKKVTVDIPGSDGILDLSEVVSGRPVYGMRTGSVEFMVSNNFKPWNELYSEILNYLHGQKLKAVLEDDPDYFYEGRFAVNEWRSDKNYSVIVIDYELYPYKKSVLNEEESL